MAKINVSLPDELLAQVDELAREFDRSRSGLVAEATKRYIADITAQRAAREREQGILAAMASMRDLANTVPPGESTEDIIRRDRDTDHGRSPRREEFR